MVVAEVGRSLSLVLLGVLIWMNVLLWMDAWKDMVGMDEVVQ